MRTLAVLCLGAMIAACQPVKVSPSPGAGGEGGGRGPDPERMPPPEQTPPPPPLILPDASAVPVDVAPPCAGLQCQQQACPNSGTTSLSGTVYAPNGKLPLYNVAVYVPNAPLDPFVQGVSCERCGTLASGKPVASALTDHEGKFTIKNVPVGKDIPLVFQVGKWRRKVTIPEVRACVDTPLMDPEVTRLPRNRKEGDMPRVAITTGSCDQLGCLIPKLGVDPAELGIAGEDKAFIYYKGRTDLLGPPNMAGRSDGPVAEPRRAEEVRHAAEQLPVLGAAGLQGRGGVRRRHQVGQQRRPHVRQPLLVRLAEVQPRGRLDRRHQAARRSPSAAPEGR